MRYRIYRLSVFDGCKLYATEGTKLTPSATEAFQFNSFADAEAEAKARCVRRGPYSEPFYVEEVPDV